MDKLCSKCSKLKKTVKYRSKSDGISAICRHCFNRELFELNPESKAKSKANSSRYYNRVKETRPEEYERRRLRNRSYMNSSDQRYKRLLHCASIRNLKVEISLEQYTEMVNHESKCVYCLGKALGVNNGYALDRVDNNKGYSIDNLVLCCGDCNWLKGNKVSHNEMMVISAMRRGKVIKWDE